MFDQNESKARKQYQKFVQGEDLTAVTDFFGKKKIGSFFGSTEFIQWVKATYGHLQNSKEISQSNSLAPAIAEIKMTVCRYYKIDPGGLLQVKRGQVNEPRNLVVYLARKMSGLRLNDIGQEFGITTYSSVSSIVTRFKKQL